VRSTMSLTSASACARERMMMRLMAAARLASGL
jgi:hypothetical protein